LEDNQRLYYGGRVCQSCRVFFRRAVVANIPFACECNFKGKPRRYMCRKCRYARCIHKAGLDPELVTVDEEDGTVRNSVSMESNVTCMSDGASDFSNLLAIHLHQYLAKSHGKYFEYFTKQPNELASFLLTLSGSGLSFTPTMHRALVQMDDMVYVNLFFEVEEIKSCSHWDKLTLANLGFRAFRGLCLAWNYIPTALPR